MWKIDKLFSFEMGHRVWTQKLNHPNLSLTTECACRHLHGHSYKIKVELEADELVRGFVTDFKNLNFVKEFLDKNLDHKFMLDINDPYFELITGSGLVLTEPIQDYTNLSDWSGLYTDFVESFVLVNWVPTSENLCRSLYEVIQQRLIEDGLNVKVSAVELWETEKSHCRYTK